MYINEIYIYIYHIYISYIYYIYIDIIYICIYKRIAMLDYNIMLYYINCIYIYIIMYHIVELVALSHSPVILLHVGSVLRLVPLVPSFPADCSINCFMGSQHGIVSRFGSFSILCMAGRENDLKFATMMIRGALVSSLPSNLECRALKFRNLELAPNFSGEVYHSQCQVSMASWAAAAQVQVPEH